MTFSVRGRPSQRQRFTGESDFGALFMVQNILLFTHRKVPTNAPLLDGLLVFFGPDTAMHFAEH